MALLLALVAVVAIAINLLMSGAEITDYKLGDSLGERSARLDLAGGEGPIDGQVGAAHITAEVAGQPGDGIGSVEHFSPPIERVHRPVGQPLGAFTQSLDRFGVKRSRHL